MFYLGAQQGALETIKFFFRLEPKLGFGCFSVCFAKPNKFFLVCFGLFRFVSVFRTSIKTTETNRENLQKTNLYQGVLETINFFRFEPKQTETQPFSVVFGFVFFVKPNKKQNFFRFVSLFRTGIETTETNRTYGMGK